MVAMVVAHAHHLILNNRITRAMALLICLASAVSAHGQAKAAGQSAWLVRQLAAEQGDAVALGKHVNGRDYLVSSSQMRRLYAVFTTLSSVAETESEFVVVAGAMPNAFAGNEPQLGNIVGVNFAMLELIGDDLHMAAAVIGHEIAHLTLKHGQQQQRESNKNQLLGALGGVLLGGLGVPASGLISAISVTALETKYSRDHERQADYLGAIWALEAGFEPAGAVRLHQALGRIPGSASSPFFSSHPSSLERVRTLQQLAERLKRNDP